MTRSRRCGGGSAWPHTGWRGSSSPPTRNWRPRSATWSGCIWTRPRARWWSALTQKSQIQALDRTQPILPMRPGQVERQTHDYVRNGTTTLFAALEGGHRAVDACLPRHRHQEFLRFLKQVAKAYPRVQLHVVCDNYATHKHPIVRAWLAKHPRVHLHFTPTSCSWLNLVECFFSIITRQAIRRGTFTSVADLTAAIETYIDGWNENAEPFTWTKPADELIDKINRAKTKTSDLTRRNNPHHAISRRDQDGW